jgi:hypothetical protein
MISIHERWRSRTRDTDWLASWGTFISAIAASIGLITGAIASWSAYSELQLQRENSEQHDASRIQFWTDHYRDWRERSRPLKGKFVHILNHTDSPIVQWEIVMTKYQTAQDGKQSFDEEPFRPDNVLPPCTETTFPLSVAEEAVMEGRTSSATFERFEFLDSSGSLWSRDRLGYLTTMDPDSFRESSTGSSTPLKAQVSPIDSCDTETSD